MKIKRNGKLFLKFFLDLIFFFKELNLVLEGKFSSVNEVIWDLFKELF